MGELGDAIWEIVAWLGLLLEHVEDSGSRRRARGRISAISDVSDVGGTARLTA
jgi:hypothetical protein